MRLMAYFGRGEELVVPRHTSIIRLPPIIFSSRYAAEQKMGPISKVFSRMMAILPNKGFLPPLETI